MEKRSLVHCLRSFALQGGRRFLDLLRLLLHHLLTLAGVAVIIAFSIAPISGIYPVYHEGHAKAAEDARNVEKVRAESTHQILEWSYVCTTLDVEGQTFTYHVTCQSFAIENNASLYKDLGCKTTIRTKPTNAKGILTVQLQDANCTKGNARERSECPNCPSPKGVDYRWGMAVFYVVLNLLFVYHCVTALCKFSYYRRLLLHEDRQSTQALRAKILARAWRVYFRIAFASVLLDLILLSLFVELTGCYFLPLWFCAASFMWIWPTNYVVTEESRFVCGLPDSVFADGTIDETEMKRLRAKEAQKNNAPQRTVYLPAEPEQEPVDPGGRHLPSRRGKWRRVWRRNENPQELAGKGTLDEGRGWVSKRAVSAQSHFDDDLR